MYDEARRSVKSVRGKMEDFTVKVSVYQGSALSQYLFSSVMDELTKNVHDEVPWCMLFADDVVLVDEKINGLEGKIER